MNVKRMSYPALAALLSVFATASWAEPGFNFSGFGTVGGVRTNTDEAQFRSTPRQDRGATRETDFGVDTKLGLQATYELNDTFSAVGQVLTSRRDGKQGPQVEWLYAQVKPVQNVDVRVGRMVLPIFMVSDNRNVGYAHYWLRAPQEVYGAYALTSFDGVQARWQNSVQDVNVTVRGSAGTSKGDIYLLDKPKSTLKYPRLYSLAVALEKGFWTVSASKTLGKDVEVKGDFFTLAPDGSDNFTNVGVQYDDGQFVAIAEYVTRRYNNQVSGPLGDNSVDSDSYYISGGYRFGAWTPYVIYSHLKPKGEGYRAFNPQTGESRPGPLSKGITRAVGVRWDAYRNVAVKAQFERVTHTEYAFMDPSWPFQLTPPAVRVWSIAVDFVF